MNTTLTPAHKLRTLLDAPGVISSVGAHDVLTALILERAGFETVFMGGFGASASLYGLPDLNYLGMSEMADALRRMASRLSVPVIGDGDTGYGGVHNVMRCVQEFERAGAAGMILEDQVFPKRCGHFEGKSVIDVDEMVRKFRAAVRARQDSDFVFVARTDARATHDLDTAIERVNRYCDAGADVAFIEAPTSVGELEEICRRVPHPKLVNMLSFGKTPILSAAELEQMGYKIVVAPIASLLLLTRAIQDLASSFRSDGHARSLFDRMASFDELKELLGLDEHLAQVREFEP